jgi:hypothetical protein
MKDGKYNTYWRRYGWWLGRNGAFTVIDDDDPDHSTYFWYDAYTTKKYYEEKTSLENFNKYDIDDAISYFEGKGNTDE